MSLRNITPKEEIQKTEKPKHYCERCAKYGNLFSVMHKQELTPEEIKEKKFRLKTKEPVFMLYLYYTYYECPICHWFKFVLGKD